MLPSLNILYEAIFDIDDDINLSNDNTIDSLNYHDIDDAIYQEKLEEIKKILGIKSKYAKIIISKNTLTVAYNHLASTHSFYVDKIKDLKTKFNISINEIIFDTKYDYPYKYPPCQIFLYGDIENIYISTQKNSNIESFHVENCTRIINSSIIIPKLSLNINGQSSYRFSANTFDIINSEINVYYITFYPIGEINAASDKAFIHTNILKVLYQNKNLSKRNPLIRMLANTGFVCRDGDISGFSKKIRRY